MTLQMWIDVIFYGIGFIGLIALCAWEIFHD